MGQFPTTPIDHDVIDPARTVKECGARNTVLADLRPEKRNISSGLEHDADTRDVDAGLWLCTNAREPQKKSVIMCAKARQKESSWKKQNIIRRNIATTCCEGDFAIENLNGAWTQKVHGTAVTVRTSPRDSMNFGSEPCSTSQNLLHKERVYAMPSNEESCMSSCALRLWMPPSRTDSSTEPL